MEKDKLEFLRELGINTIKELETDEGITASSRDEIYGCIFGRDSLITCLFLLSAYGLNKDQYFLELVKKILANLFALQGKEENVESGEQPGKCIHEYRPNNHEHLTFKSKNPWYLYDGKILKNYDSIDATPLLLIAIYRYYQKSKDMDFLNNNRAGIEAALDWILKYGDSNGDGFVDFGMNSNRKSGGLPVQNWMDSPESIFHEDGSVAVFPIAPVEVQAYCFLALRLWSEFYKNDLNKFIQLKDRADKLKKMFNGHYIFFDSSGKLSLASAVDASGKQIVCVRSAMGHCLWASLDNFHDEKRESILNDEIINGVVERIMMSDLFVPEAGVRTLSFNSTKFSPNSYHNGSIWPHDSMLIAEGMEKNGFVEEAQKIRQAVLNAIYHFATPVELFVYNDGFDNYLSHYGQAACRKQAWCAGGILNAAVKLLAAYELSVSQDTAVVVENVEKNK